MTTGDKAKRATVAIGPSSVKGFQMPDGSYRMSQSGAATTINESPVYALRFLASRDSKALLGETFTDYTPEQIEVEPSPCDLNALLAQRLRQTEADLAVLGEACAEFGALREQMARLEQQLHDAGLEPWQLPLIER